MPHLPSELKYHEYHTWCRAEADTVMVGITDPFQHRLGEIWAVGLPDTQHGIAAGDEVGALESAKAVVALFSPLSGQLVAVNEGLLEAPGLINRDPYGDGWLFQLRLSDAQEYAELITADDYAALLQDDA